MNPSACFEKACPKIALNNDSEFELNSKFFWQLLILTLVIVNGGCNYTRFKTTNQDFRNTPVLDKVEAAKIGYAKVYSEVIDGYCISCHRSGKYPLNSYQETLSIIDKIRSSVFQTGTMPKGRTLPESKRTILLTWINAGAPEFGQNPEPVSPPLEPTFSSIRDRIFKVRCGTCHEPTGPECISDKPHNKESCRLEISNFDELINGIDESRKEMVIPGDAESSQLTISIERSDASRMPPPDEGYEALSEEEIAIIKEWINIGAPNN